ncbi:MAG: PD40 domain-containing protein, partial [Thermoguttaceae bacterium]|nr:PD40 domain-containing protein [Thermoguttaceae bacterium]
MAEPGGRMLIVGLNPGGEVKNVLEGHEGSFWRPDISFDAQKILFSFQPKGEKSFHLYECNIDGSDMKQLTQGDYDDLDPIYTPDGKIIFCSSRQHSYVRCMPMTHSFAVTRCDADGKNIYVISANGEPEYLPSMLPDGRVIFTRWEYTDKALWRVQSLWTMNPDGTNTQTFWGNQSVWPDVLTEARFIPGTRKVMFTAVGHHAWFNGSIGIIDSTAGLNYPDGLERVTREVAWPEVGNGPTDPAPSVDYHVSGKHFAYKSPYPLSEEYFLVSARDGDHLYSGDHHNWFFDLYFMDIYGNKELIYTGEYNAYYASPVRERDIPPARPDTVQWPKIGSDEKPAPGILYSNNVFEGAPEILKEKGKAIRVVQMDPKTYTTWNKTVQHDGPAISVFQAEGVKRILGTVPIEEDGSVRFEVPSGEAFFFEMLDEEGRAIHVMRSFTNVMPGEERGCFGCHESTLATQSNQVTVGAQAGLATQKPAKKLTPPSWGTEESIGYYRFVQKPVLDVYCAKCHQDPENDAYK